MSIALVFFNLALFMGLSPLLDGILRRLTARVQSRKGPPLFQTYFDLLKLLGKENIDSAGTWPFRLAPIIALASILTVISVMPLAGRATALTPIVDSISLVCLLTLGGVAVLLGALASRNTYAAIGASREMITMIMVEPVLAMILLLGVLNLQSLDLMAALHIQSLGEYAPSTLLMAAVYLFALQAFVGRQPFDIAEAEVEILGGPFIEYSGPNYALFKYYLLIKQMFYAYLPVAIFVPGLRSRYWALDLSVQLVALLFVYFLVGILGSTNPRLRIDQAIPYFAVLIGLAISALGMSLYGI